MLSSNVVESQHQVILFLSRKTLAELVPDEFDTGA
jgi:hypothetical protein